MQSAELKSVLEAGALLAGSTRSEGATKLDDLLRTRLRQYSEHTGRVQLSASATLGELQVETACAALSVLEQVQTLLSRKHTQHDRTAEKLAEEELLGTRDLVQIRTLLSLVFKWATEPWLSRVCASIPSTTPGGKRKAGNNIIDLTSVPDDFKRLADTVARLIHLILPGGVQGAPNATVLSSVLLDKHLGDLLRPSLALGWLPKTLASESVFPVDDLRPVVVRLMLMMPASSCIVSLSTILSDPSSLPYVRRSCRYLMSRQLLRQDGIRGLFIALFAGDDISAEDAPLEKMENASKVLQTLPSGMDASDYYSNIVPQLLSFLSQDVPPSHQRVAAFVISRLLASNEHHAVVSRILLPVLHKPFLQLIAEATDHSASSSGSVSAMSPTEALNTLQVFLTNTDPSPDIMSRIMTPVVPSLYALSYSLDKVKSVDPAIKTTLTGLLGTWGRLIGGAEGTATLWLVIDGEGGDWKVDVAGQIRRVQSRDEDVLSFFTPESLRQAEASGELDVDANVLNLRPDPVHFVKFVKSLDRPEIASELFTRLLEAYRESKAASESDPLRTLLYLQLVVQVQDQLFSGESAIKILKKPDHVLSFIKHALQSAQNQAEKQHNSRPQRRGLGLEDLRIVEEEDQEDELDSQQDSDDEGMEVTASAGDDDMTSTAVSLLLSVLEANPDLSTENAPILNDIFLLLEKLAKEGAEELKTLAREARMVRIARLASTSVSPSLKPKSSAKEETVVDTYQKALKLLQDPLLPVRAHGLLLLRQLVSSRQPPDESGGIAGPTIDRALIPGIMSIFLQSLQDDDSYIFLNAVQGLSAMVDGFGKEVLSSLIDAYTTGLDGIGASNVSQQDVDVRTRIGETLGQVIRRCGSALPKYIDQIAPPLNAVMRSSHLPTALRTSAVSLLALCTNTSSLAVLPWATDLLEAMIDLLQIESVPISQVSKTDTKVLPKDDANGEVRGNAAKAPKHDSVDFRPTTKDPRIPILRRSALHLLALLIQAFISQIDDPASKSLYVLPGELMRRAKNTVGYIAVTDEDEIVRVMAKEASEGLDSLAEAMLGL